MMAKSLYLGLGTRYDSYEFGTTKKGWDPDEGFPRLRWVKSFCSKELTDYTGIKLKPGEIRRVKSITIDLEPS